MSEAGSEEMPGEGTVPTSGRVVQKCLGWVAQTFGRNN